MSRKLAFGVAAAVLVPTAIAASATSTSASDELSRPQHHPGDEPTLEWVPCFEERTAETGVPFECADLEVPLDYDRPWRDSIFIAVVRIPAADQANRQGAILLNPGGPGASGIDFAVGFGPFVPFAFGPEVAERFDIVGFDPRGILRSTPIRCFHTFEESIAVFPPLPFPLTKAEEKPFRQSNRTLAKACRHDHEARRIGRHMSTANVARDMDMIRAALGDDELNYLGLSYGSFLGATYANLFPDRVRSVVVDGILDPIAWVNEEREVPFSTRLRSDEGAQDTLEEFFAQCEAAASGNCALAPGAEDRYAAIAESLLEGGPVELVDPFTGEPFLVTYQDLIAITLGELYNPFGYAFLAGLLAEIEAAQAAAASGSVAVTAFGAAAYHPREEYPNFAEGFPAVACTDTRNPRSIRAWREAGIAADEEFGYFGRIWTWASIPCQRWPFKDRDRYAGPFDTETANPVLIIGNLYDPATPYGGSQALRALLPNSGLLTVDVPGHTSLGASNCAGFFTGQYFLDPSVALAVDGTTCPAEFNAFDVVAGPPAAPTESTDASSDTDAGTAEVATQIEARAALDEVLGTFGR